VLRAFSLPHPFYVLICSNLERERLPMLTIYSDDHKLHHGNGELMNGSIVPCFEMPRRAELILERVRAVQLGEVIAPRDFGVAPLTRVHSPAYLSFLETAWASWSALERDYDALPMTWPVRGMNQSRPPQHIEAKLGFYSFDGGAPIQAGTWRAVYSSAQVALEGAAQLAQASAAFALCRPPGHHAASDLMGGYCYFNNAAVAAQALLDAGASRVAILDIDYHHGNGTQEMFYSRDDVLVVNLHGDPVFEYPFFLGHADETGHGAGEGYNLNLPLPAGTGFEAWFAALEVACARVDRFAPDVVVVSLGVDTFKDDPISQFRLASEDYLRVGQRIAVMGLKTLFVMEGGYAVAEIGVNAVNVLAGFEIKMR
jgi:acetoin utilization deacetylase AcuC-like enzyme